MLGPAFIAYSFWGYVISIGIISLLLLQIFIIIGIFKGQRWTMFISIVFIVMNLISALVPNFNLTTSLAALIFHAALMYFPVSCLLHPFYGGKK